MILSRVLYYPVTGFWRKDLIEQLAKTQKPNGSWANEADRWMEGDSNLVTAFSLMALSTAKPK